MNEIFSWRNYWDEYVNEFWPGQERPFSMPQFSEESSIKPMGDIENELINACRLNELIEKVKKLERFFDDPSWETKNMASWYTFANRLFYEFKGMERFPDLNESVREMRESAKSFCLMSYRKILTCGAYQYLNQVKLWVKARKPAEFMKSKISGCYFNIKFLDQKEKKKYREELDRVVAPYLRRSKRKSQVTH